MFLLPISAQAYMYCTSVKHNRWTVHLPPVPISRSISLLNDWIWFLMLNQRILHQKDHSRCVAGELILLIMLIISQALALRLISRSFCIPLIKPAWSLIQQSINICKDKIKMCITCRKADCTDYRGPWICNTYTKVLKMYRNLDRQCFTP